MGEILDFENRRKGFVQQNRVENVQLVGRTREQTVSPIHTRMNTRGLSAKERNKLNERAAKEWATLTPRQQRKEYKKMKEDLNQHGYKTATRNSIRRISGRRTGENMKGKIFAIVGLASALLVGIGGYGIYASTYNQPATLEETMQNGKTAEGLGIENDTLAKIQNLEERLYAEDIGDEEIMKIGKELEALQLNVFKTKTAAVTGVDVEDIKAYTNLRKSEPSVENVEIGDDIVRDNNLPKEVQDYIALIANTQRNNNNMEEGRFDNKNEIIERFRSTLEETNEFAAGELGVEKDSEGKITKINYTQTTKQDLEQQNVEHDEER